LKGKKGRKGVREGEFRSLMKNKLESALTCGKKNSQSKVEVWTGGMCQEPRE
jgi:hypothetical protein